MNEIDTLTITVSRYEATMLMAVLDHDARKNTLSVRWSDGITEQLDRELKARGTDLDKVRKFVRKML